MVWLGALCLIHVALGIDQTIETFYYQTVFKMLSGLLHKIPQRVDFSISQSVRFKATTKKKKKKIKNVNNIPSRTTTKNQKEKTRGKNLPDTAYHLSLTYSLLGPPFYNEEVNWKKLYKKCL